MVADNLSDEQVDVFKQMFDMMDKDKNGNLSFEELRDGLSMIGHAIPDPDVQMLMDAVSFLHAELNNNDIWTPIVFFYQQRLVW